MNTFLERDGSKTLSFGKERELRMLVCGKVNGYLFNHLSIKC